MKLDRVPPRILIALGLVGTVGATEGCTTTSACLSIFDPTDTDTGSGSGASGTASDSGTGGTAGSGDEISATACLSPPSTFTDDSTGGTTTVGPCLEPMITTGTDSGSGSGSGSGSDSGSESGSDSGTSTGAGAAPGDPDAVLERVLSTGALPADVQARLRRRGGR